MARALIVRSPGALRAIMSSTPGLITWVTAAGLGGLARPLSGPGWVGLRCYLGFLLIPLFLL
ncbi:MAG TPA: hypothetical protein VGA81_11815, partial [Methylomirabilota bacterium]